ncbi:MAG: TonB-dependent receptor plug domain-containing protein, partial [Prevotella sp.]|nr:TonB-dependent receptor plug domain-containing protein [Prevotella sp.]
MMKRKKLFGLTESIRCLFLMLMLVIISTGAAAQNGTLKGKVTGASDGEPLIGVSAVVKGTTKGSVTDYDGNYTLTGLKKGDVIVFSYIGYLKKEQAYTGQTIMNVKLDSDSKTLEDVVVIGYGTMKKKLVTGATMQIKGDDIQKLNTVNPLSAMQGQTPGVNIVSTSGQPGAAMSVTIRGLGTVGNSQPLYLIDGIAGDITNLNPADIERIDVLKDAASAAIYGAQAANGVILVTTKGGKEGTSRISYDGYVG